MDFQKEKEAFESVFTEAKGWDLTFIMGCYQNIETLRAFAGWLAAKAQAVPEGYVLVPREMQWHKADDLACLEWGRHAGLFYSENRDMSALQVEEFRLRWCKNKANKIMSDYKAMIEAQEPTND